MMTLQLEIPKRSPCCCKGGEPFLPGSLYFSALVKGNDEIFQRRDFCVVCWESADICKTNFWKSLVPQKKEASELPKRRDERALYLLKEAISCKHHEDSMAEAFVLALYLARRRLISLRQEIQHENRVPVNVYEIIETEEILCVPKLSLSELQVEKIQIELAKKFNGSLA